MKTTPTGIPVARCESCGRDHPVTRSHCIGCGIPSLFLNDGGACLTCGASDV